MLKWLPLKKGLIIPVVGILLSVLFLYLSFRGIDRQRVLSTLGGVDLRLIPACFLSVLVSNLLASYKWALIEGNSRLRQTLPSLYIGLFVNNVLPVRIGELARAYVLSRKARTSLTYAFSTVLLDRFFDLLALLSLALIFLPEKEIPRPVIGLFRVLFVVLVLTSTLFFFAGRKKTGLKIALSLERKKPGIARMVLSRLREIQVNVARLNSPRLMPFLLFVAILQWSFMALALFFAALALKVRMPFIHLPFVCSLLNLGLLIPSSPGYVGIYEFLLILLLSILGVARSEAFSLSILFHTVWYSFYTTLGFVFFLREGLKIGEIKRL